MIDEFIINNEYMDDLSWDSLFAMAESLEEQGDVLGYGNVNFNGNDCMQGSLYNTPEEALKSLFGYDSFRPGQKSVIDNILLGRDTFAIMPTGAGKSVCYQIPAMLLSGITLVISPLISLMQDQVKALNEMGVSAAFINSSLSANAYYETIQKARQGLYKIIYVAPERLVTEGFLDFARNVQISMVTVDEAHCISQWGQDFRPSYMKIVEFVKSLERRPIISAFTATATENVREDIVCTLGLVNPYTLVTGFNRENLFFQVDKSKNKEQFILDYITGHTGESGIIYCATRKNVDSLFELLKSKGISVAKYHAGMSAVERKQMQDEFVFDYTDIIVATNAFGMGIDKSNVRFVIHYNMPQSMENYYQEAGRAGRDGLDSKCILLFSPQDIIINKFLLEHKEMSDLDPNDRETINVRDAQRLQVMERYCYTTDCLRNYILKYFGEKPEKPCEECGNCLREFETLDMTEEAKKVINCVYETKGRFGKTIIIDIVVGAKTARLEEIGATKYKSYGVLNSINKNLLKRLIEQMVLEGYLMIGDYQVIKMGNISNLKNSETTILVKITDEDKKCEKATKKKTVKGTESLTSAGFKLFDKLRALRLEIAREESMPPYIIFSDKTLIDMAVKVPISQYEMMNVSGVGENKYIKYGERFLAEIEKWAEVYPELIQNKVEVTNEEKETENKAKKKTGKKEYFLLRDEAENFKYTEYMNISEIRDEMNRICVRDNIKKLFATRLIEVLVSEGFIAEVEREGKFRIEPTKKGTEQGIKSVEKVGEKGYPYMVLMYPMEVQRILVEHYICEDNNDESAEKVVLGKPSYYSLTDRKVLLPEQTNTSGKEYRDVSWDVITNASIEETERLVQTTDSYGPENELISRCLKKFPLNTDPDVVAMKIGLIDITNSTHLSQHKSKISMVELANIIVGIPNIDERIQAGDPEVVNEIARSNGRINLFSFASKYCCYHNRNLYGKDDYSILDTVLKEYLPRYFEDITKSQIQKWQDNYQYREYNDYITRKLDEYGIIAENRKRKFDHYVWYKNRRGQE